MKVKMFANGPHLICETDEEVEAIRDALMCKISDYDHTTAQNTLMENMVLELDNGKDKGYYKY